MANTIIKGIPNELKEYIGEYGMCLLSKIHKEIPGTMLLLPGKSKVPGIFIDSEDKLQYEDYLKVLRAIDPDACDDELWSLAFLLDDDVQLFDGRTFYEWED